MSEKEFNSRMKVVQFENKSKERKQKLKEEENKYKRKWVKVETSKLLALYLFLIFNIVLVYAMKAMWEFRDLTALGILITDIIGQILLYGIYCLKAYKGKKQEEYMKFEKEKLFGVSVDNEGVEENMDTGDTEAVG